ncbi:MAG: helix-turn-helix domain-containing protein, partial [Oscillospiraceae bacterium]|nr:helix-turn-helix domain-containing protein [Oscillospiraceae bacterium]
MHYVELIKQLRRRNGLTQQQVADFLHIDRSTYAYYESGRTKISVEALLHLARLYQITLGQIVGENAPAEVLADDTDYSTALIDDSIVRFAQKSNQKNFTPLRGETVCDKLIPLRGGVRRNGGGGLGKKCKGK